MRANDPEAILVLDRDAVRSALQQIDPLVIVDQALADHARGWAEVPQEAYLGWANSEAAHCRSLAMLGGLTMREPPVYGVKIINASASNVRRGMARAGGMNLLFDPETARPRVLADAAYISAIRTAAYTIVSLRRLGPDVVESIAVLGCGYLAHVHLKLISKYLPSVIDVNLYDLEVSRAQELAEQWTRISGREATVHSEPRIAASSSPVLITLTTSVTPYIPLDWLPATRFVAHVSLDDLLPEVFFAAEAIYVDDIGLVRENPRRVLGRLVQDVHSGTRDGYYHRPLRIGRTLGEVVVSSRQTKPSHGGGLIVSNPFGMSILDIALLDAVWKKVADLDVGYSIRLW